MRSTALRGERPTSTDRKTAFQAAEGLASSHGRSGHVVVRPPHLVVDRHREAREISIDGRVRNRHQAAGYRYHPSRGRLPPEACRRSAGRASGGASRGACRRSVVRREDDDGRAARQEPRPAGPPRGGGGVPCGPGRRRWRASRSRSRSTSGRRCRSVLGAVKRAVDAEHATGAVPAHGLRAGGHRGGDLARDRTGRPRSGCSR